MNAYVLSDVFASYRRRRGCFSSLLWKETVTHKEIGCAKYSENTDCTSPTKFNKLWRS